MFTFDVTKWVPRFLLNDKNGYALAKAIEAGIQAMNNTIQQGVDCIANYDTMPEWRLDELAWETNCLYDYSADVETKRQWIKSAIPLYRLFGTPQAVYRYIGSYFDDIYLEEDWIYNGQPYHFRVTAFGEWTPKNEAWARKAIATAKNVRSVLDSIAIGSKCTIKVKADGSVIGRFFYPMTGPDTRAGTIPQENTIGRKADGVFAFQADAQGHVYGYPISGTQPEINMLGAIRSGSIRPGGEGEGHVYGYPQTSTDASAGTVPQENTLAALSDGGIRASPEGVKASFPYASCGENVCGQGGL